MSAITPQQFRKALLTWFDKHGRKHLPWQKNKTPYRVWVSEIMLQQTQVTTVIPYYEKFMSRFPDIHTLSSSPLDDILHLWAGLGYYSRARNLHKAAQTIVQKFDGVFPDTLETIESLPGIGHSTAGAILSIAFEKPAAILDGNVKRVLTRLHGIQKPLDKTVEIALWDIAKAYAPTKRTADYTQAIMDLGATLCTRSKPQCNDCPLQHFCVGFKKGIASQLPAKTMTKSIPTKTATFLVIRHQSKLFLQKRPPSGIWGGLWCLPEMAKEPDFDAIKSYCLEKFKQPILHHALLPSFRHTFTHYHLQLFPVLIEIKKPSAKVVAATNEIWYNPAKPDSLGLPKPIQRILQGLHQCDLFTALS